MTAPSYSNGGAWTTIPSAAIYGTHPGTYHVEYPPAADYTYAGAPCAAVGLPSVVIRTAWLTDTGMGFWQGYSPARERSRAACPSRRLIHALRR